LLRGRGLEQLAMASSLAHSAVSGVRQIEISSASGYGSNFIQFGELIARRADGSDAVLSTAGATATATSAYANNTCTDNARKGVEWINRTAFPHG
jgi:hypothetical protein